MEPLESVLRLSSFVLLHIEVCHEFINQCLKMWFIFHKIVALEVANTH